MRAIRRTAEVIPPAGLRYASLLLLAACQPQVELTQPIESDPAAARRELAALAREGPVPLVVLGDFAGLDPDERDRLVSDAVASGLRGLDVTFDPVPPDQAPGRRLVVALNPRAEPAPEALCTELASGGRPEPGAERVAAALCQGEVAIGAVTGTIEGTGARARERLLWRTADRLFPDDYEDTYGFDVLPDWLGVGAGGSFGF